MTRGISGASGGAWLWIALITAAGVSNVFGQGLFGPTAGADRILRRPIPFSDSAPRSARLAATVSNELPRRDSGVHPDLVGNQNRARSLGWISIASVPEPTTLAIVGTALVFFFAFQWRNE